MNIQLQFSLPVWLMAGFLYTLYFTTAVLLFSWTCQMLCYWGKKRMGLWVWKAWIGLQMSRDANKLSDTVVEMMLNDYAEQTGRHYRLQSDVDTMNEIGATFPSENEKD